jgi:hypothetical protein
VLACAALSCHADDVVQPPLLVVPQVPSLETASPIIESIDSVTADPVPVLIPGFWVVATWNSPQSFVDSSPAFCPSIQRFDEGVGSRGSNLAQLKASLIPGVPVCIGVHGSFMDQNYVASYASSTYDWLKAGSCGRPFYFIYLSWPSDRTISALATIDVAILGQRASRNGFYLLDLMHCLPAESPVCLVGHSHGTRVISSALHLMGGGTVEGLRHKCPGTGGRQIRAVYMASAIDHDWLNPGERYDRALRSVECLINLQNRRDPALKIYPLHRLGLSRALGCSGFTDRDYEELGWQAGRVRNWDVSNIVGAGHFWPNYVKRPQLARGLRNYLYFADATQSPSPMAAIQSAAME